MGSYVASPALEVQTRACEYTASFQHASRPDWFEHMPALDEATYSGCARTGQPAHPCGSAIGCLRRLPAQQLLLSVLSIMQLLERSYSGTQAGV